MRCSTSTYWCDVQVSSYFWKCSAYCMKLKTG
uniref:Uncharacterized protein n=1 Tax=Anguilla anguilla TaxID=7936 RepID=A0A0E9TLR7_ANGAN